MNLQNSSGHQCGIGVRGTVAHVLRNVGFVPNNAGGGCRSGFNAIKNREKAAIIHPPQGGFSQTTLLAAHLNRRIAGHRLIIRVIRYFRYHPIG